MTAERTGERVDKRLTEYELKQDGTGEPTGEVRAAFSVFDAVDSDGDIIRREAFTDGQEVPMVWHHQWPVIIGKGVVKVQQRRAIFDGRFFLDTTAGADAFKTVRNMENLQEWSFGFRVSQFEMAEQDEKTVRVIKGLELFEVSPVLKGANSKTGTLAIKAMGGEPEAKAAIGSHSTATTTAAWDGPGNVARLRSEEDLVYYRRVYAWRDPEGEVGAKSTYKFPHHVVSGDGDPGAASVRACVSGIGILNGGRGGADIPDGDRKGVYDHLAGHLRDAEVEPPELRSKAVRLADDLMALLAAAVTISTRVRTVAEMRAKDGRALGEATRNNMELVREELAVVLADIRVALEEPVSPDVLQGMRARASMSLSRARRG